MTIPVMLNLGYSLEFSAAVVTVAGGLGCIIPPSIPFVLYSTSAGTSVGDMFIAGIVPGFLLGGLLMIYAVYYCIRKGEDRERIHTVVSELRGQGFLHLFLDSFWALLTPVIILGSIYGGIATPTEAAVVSVYYSLFVSVFIYKTIKPSQILSVCMESLKTIAPILFVLSAAVSFGRVLALMNVPQMVGTWITSTFSEKWQILLIVNIFLLFVGMVMDAAPAILDPHPHPGPCHVRHRCGPHPLRYHAGGQSGRGLRHSSCGHQPVRRQLHDKASRHTSGKGQRSLYSVLCHRPCTDRHL